MGLRVPPAFSPASPRHIAGAVRDALGGDPRPQLEATLRTKYEAEEAVLTASGTQALSLAIRLIGNRLPPDVPVALPAYSCFDIATAAVGAGRRIALYDLDPSSLGPDFDSLDRTLRGGARIVVVAPLYGIPVDWTTVQEIANRHDAVVIEDAAQGHGAAWHGRPLGSLGVCSILSFGRGKGWTGGGGGALLLRDGWSYQCSASLPEAREAAPQAALGAFGQWALARPGLYALPAAVPWLRLGETVYRAPKPTSRMSRFTSGLILRTGQAAEREAAIRIETGKYFLRHAKGTTEKFHTFRTPERSVSGYLRFPIRLAESLDASAIQRKSNHLGIGLSYPHTLGKLPAVQNRLVGKSVVPGAETLVRDLITLPTHSRLPQTWREHLLHWVNTLPIT